MADEAYRGFAAIYDDLMYDVDYREVACFIGGFRSEGFRHLLDVGCGTGTILSMMSPEAASAAGLDISPEMADAARAKNPEAFIVTGDMRSPDSYTGLPDYGRYDMVISLFDCLNYLPDMEDLEKTFRNIFDAMAPGGTFVFDMNTEYKLSTVLGDDFYYDLGDSECYVWQNEYDPETRCCQFDLTFFAREEDGRYRRMDELHREYAYPAEDVAAALRKTGFEDIRVMGDLKCAQPAKDEERVCFVAVRP